MRELAESTSDVLEICRKLLLTEAYAGKARKPSTKESLKKILSALIVAHSAGVAFDTMAELLSRAGLKVTADTLRSYYFVLRKELEVTVSAKKHASAAASFAMKLHKKFTGEELKLAHPKMVDVDVEPARKIKATKNKTSKAEEQVLTKTTGEELLPSGASSSLPIDRPITNEAIPTIAKVSSIQDDLPKPAPQTMPGEDATAKTLEEIDALSREKEIDRAFEHLPLAEDVILREGRVYLSSGKPFVGTLTEKQVSILKRNEKLMSRSPSRTDKDFVTTPRFL